jgi:hypothetical protein
MGAEYRVTRIIGRELLFYARLPMAHHALGATVAAAT